MKGFGPETFGALYADSYDAGLQMDDETRDSVAFLAELAHIASGDRVLELAIGTGRMALPLAARGLQVHGIEASEQMVAKLREKPGGDKIPVVIGDMADVAVDGTFDLAFLVFNTIYNLTTQEAQVRLFQGVADHLADDGVFVVETFVPDLADIVDGQRVRAREVTADMARFEVLLHDPVAQTWDMQRIVITNDGARVNPLAMRYAWPSELDLMARLAGLELRERWAGWDRSPFTAESKRHVSVYGWRKRSDG